MGTKQTRPQAPQLLTSLLVFVSQPSTGLLLQSAKPGLQDATVQTPTVQAGVPFATKQTRPQAPQLLTLVVILTSQPLAGLLSQSAKPGLQLATVHVPPLHPAVPLATAQTFPQLPQLFGSVLVLTQTPPQMVCGG